VSLRADAGGEAIRCQQEMQSLAGLKKHGGICKSPPARDFKLWLMLIFLRIEGSDFFSQPI